MKRVPRDRYTFVFAADVPPVLEVEPGEEVVFETPGAWMTCASARALQDAVRLATRDMVDFLARRRRVGREDAFLTATAGDGRIGQACAATLDSTARMSFPKIPGLEGPLAQSAGA